MNLGEPPQKNDPNFDAHLAYHIDVIIVTWAALSVIVVLGSVILSCICCYSKGTRRHTSSSFYSYSDSQRDTVHLEDLLSKPSLADPESVFSEISIDGCLSVRTGSWIGTSEANSSPVLDASASAQCIDSMALQSSECHNTATASVECISQNPQDSKRKWKSHSQKNITTKNKALYVSKKKRHSRSQSVQSIHGSRGKSSHDLTRRGADIAHRTKRKLNSTVNMSMNVQSASRLMKEELTAENVEHTFNKQGLLPNETKLCDNTDGSETSMQTSGGEEYTKSQEKEVRSKSVTNKTEGITTELRNTENVKPNTSIGNQSIGQQDIVCHVSTDQTNERACVTIESQAKINHVMFSAGNLDDSKTGDHRPDAQSTNIDAALLNARYHMPPPQVTRTSVETKIGSSILSSQGREIPIPMRRSISQISESTNAIVIPPKMKTLSLNLQIDFHFENEAGTGVKPPVSVIRCASASDPTPEEEDTETAHPLSHSPRSRELTPSSLQKDPKTTVKKDTLRYGATRESTDVLKSRIRFSESTISKTDTAFSKEAKRRYSLDESHIGVYKEINDNLPTHDFITSNLDTSTIIDTAENTPADSGNKGKTKLPTTISDPITTDNGTIIRDKYDAVAPTLRKYEQKRPASTDVSELGTHSGLDDKRLETQNVNHKGDIVEEICEGITGSQSQRVGITQELTEPSEKEESRDITKPQFKDNFCAHNLSEQRATLAYPNASRAAKSNSVSNLQIKPTEGVTRMRSVSAEYGDRSESWDGTKKHMTSTSDPNLHSEKNIDCRSENATHSQRSGSESEKYAKTQSKINPELVSKKLPPRHSLEVEENVFNYSEMQKCEENTAKLFDKKKNEISPESKSLLGSRPIPKKRGRFDREHSKTPANQCNKDFGSNCCQNNGMIMQEAKIDNKPSRTDGGSESCIMVPQEQNQSKDIGEAKRCSQVGEEETSEVKSQTRESAPKHIYRNDFSHQPLLSCSVTYQDDQDRVIDDEKVVVDFSDKNEVQPEGEALQKQNQILEPGIGLAQNLAGSVQTGSTSRMDLQVNTKSLIVLDPENSQEAENERGEDDQKNTAPDIIVSDESDYDNPWDDLDSAVKRASIRYNRRPSRIAAGDTKTLMLKSAEDLGRLLEEAEKRRNNRRIEARSSCKIPSPRDDESNLTIPFTRFSPHRHTVKGIMPQPAVEAAPVFSSSPPIPKRSKTPSPKLSLFRSRQVKNATVGIDPDRPKSLSSKVRSKISSPETKIRKK